MSLAAEFRALALEFLDDFGTESAATYVVPGAVDSDSGVVTETPTEVAVRLYGPLGETVLDQAAGATVRFIIPAEGFSPTPAIGHRIVLGDRVWTVKQVGPVDRIDNQVVAWDLACAETALEEAGDG